MYKFLLYLLIFFCGINLCYSSASIFNYPSTSKFISQQMSKLNDVSCKFTQEKYIGNTVLKSRGNFKFIKEKGVTFETLYPIKSTVTYSSSQNKQMNYIISSIVNGNYTYLDKNFNLYYKKENENWTIGLKPKPETVPAAQLHNIIVKGSNDINNIKVETIKNGITDISFKCGTD